MCNMALIWVMKHRKKQTIDKTDKEIYISDYIIVYL